jgi:hypothetical protein
MTGTTEVTVSNSAPWLPEHYYTARSTMTELLHSKEINDGMGYKEDVALLEKARSP